MTQATILITGGTGKFGKRYVEHFCKKGWDVVFTTTSSQRGRELSEAQEGVGRCLDIECDLTQDGSVEYLNDILSSEGIRVNHLVNNARSLSHLKVGEDGVTNREDFVSEYLMDVVVPYELSMSLWKRQPDALTTITNISSQYGVVAANSNLYDEHAQQSPIQYSVAKAALNQMTRELAVRMASDAIRVNAVAYGGVEGRTDEAFKTRYSRMVPNGRMLSESEIPGPVDFLASEGSSAITGHVLMADGGWTTW